jgi:DNA-binding beta-propeller fold protein YncE
MKICSIVIIFFLLSIPGLLAQHASNEFKIQKIIPVAGNGTWDNMALDNGTQKIFVTHGDCVQVLDIKTGKQAGIINHTPGAHCITIAREFNKGFITAGKIDSLIVFDLNDYHIMDRIPTGKNPDAVLFDQFSERVFAFNSKGNSITVIDAESDEVKSTLALRGSPSFALTDVSGNIYVNLENIGIVAMIDAVTLEIRRMLPIGSDKRPIGMALDKGNDILFVGCNGTNELIVLDRFSGQVVTTIPIGMHCEGVCYMPALNEIFTSNGEGTVTVIHQDTPDKYTKEQTLVTKRGARTLLCNYAQQSIYLPTAEFNDIKKDYDPDSFQVIVVSK